VIGVTFKKIIFTRKKLVRKKHFKKIFKFFKIALVLIKIACLKKFSLTQQIPSVRDPVQNVVYE